MKRKYTKEKKKEGEYGRQEKKIRMQERGKAEGNNILK